MIWVCSIWMDTEKEAHLYYIVRIKRLRKEQKRQYTQVKIFSPKKNKKSKFEKLKT